jgi:hypothetical protein
VAQGRRRRRQRGPSAAEIAQDSERSRPTPEAPDPRLDSRSGQGLTDAEDLPARWLRKYGAPIDCDELRLLSAPVVCEGFGLEDAVDEVSRPLADLLERQAAARQKLLTRRLRGRGESLADIRAREEEAPTRAARALPLPRVAVLARALLSQLDDYDATTAKFVKDLRSRGVALEIRQPCQRE